jgi:hypothetical protein
MITHADNIEEYSGSRDQHDAWVAEAIWGHRLERQPFSALMLEFLGMAEGMHRQDNLFALTRPSDDPQYSANQSLQLRNILFNNPRMEEIWRNSHGSDDEAWSTWLAFMRENARMGSRLSADFSYLRTRFDNFGEMVNVVRLLRRIMLDPGSERNWTTQFIFPVGPASLYEALLEKGEGFERTRRVYTRTGEIVYLMLSRAAEPWRTKIRAALAPAFDPATSRNRLLLRLISSPEPDRGDRKGGTYLPYKTHPAFDRMAEDVAAILSLKLPDQDAFQYLQPLLGLHVYLYGIETANHWLGDHRLPPVVCEILAPHSDLVRKASIESYLHNDALGLQAVRRYLEQSVFSAADLQRTLADEALDDVAKRDFLIERLIQKCAWDRTKAGGANATEVRQRFVTFAERLYRNGTADGLTGLATGSGLASKRGTNRIRYAPTDDLLRALVLANVTAPVEEAEFLRTLHRRYRIAIGPVEAKQEVLSYQFDDADFKRNRDRLAQRLVGMGLARRMSDACTYIINPIESAR